MLDLFITAIFDFVSPIFDIKPKLVPEKTSLLMLGIKFRTIPQRCLAFPCVQTLSIMVVFHLPFVSIFLSPSFSFDLQHWIVSTTYNQEFAKMFSFLTQDHRDCIHQHHIDCAVQR